jgi:uncharacterized membrane protein HdeD (DUF308 family)
MKNETTLASQLPLNAMEGLHRHWGLFLLLGILLIVLGMIGISASGLFTLASVVFFGWLLVISGAGVVIHAFCVSRWSGFFLQLLSGLLYLIVGWILVARPGLGALTLTLVFAISLVVQGAFRIGAAVSTRMDGWGLLLLSGIVTLVLGLMIWNEWPLSGLWVIGLFVGIELLFYGWWLVSLAFSARRLAAAT